MKIFIIGDPILPEFPSNGQPTIGQAAVSLAFGTDVRKNHLIIRVGPGGDEEGFHGPLLGNGTELLVAGTAEGDDVAPATCIGNRTSACHGLQGLWGRKPHAVIPEFSQQGRGKGIMAEVVSREEENQIPGSRKIY